MYKIILSHEVMPGKLADMKRWLVQQDIKRKEENPDYTPPKRYITVAGSVHQVTVEVEGEEIPVSMLEHPYAEGPAEGAQGEFLQWIVPGRTEIRLLKELDLGSS
jgi:hypothetical protein